MTDVEFSHFLSDVITEHFMMPWIIGRGFDDIDNLGDGAHMILGQHVR
jgi:hypothetical protein